jgi:2-oxoglutarate ferredoxin oxidoreductase subunit alpha
VQEAVELTQNAFDLADKYRNPVLVMGDGLIGQMMEPVEMPDYVKPELPEKTWAATGWKPGCGRERAVINSLYIDPTKLEEQNQTPEAK